ncbi:MAG TPA: hypothetical protein PLU17_06010 [Chitinophagaceae bacterium]|nr:hypothetical protein [Chitinophagaceae bacterium]
MRYLLTGLISLFLTLPISACDICGCSSGSNSLGVLPRFQSSFIGIRYQTQQFRSKPHHILNEQFDGSREIFHTTEIWGRYNPHRRVQIFGFIPYRMNDRIEGNNSLMNKGLGDMQLLINYLAYYTPIESNSIFKQSLQFGAGIKLPTGNYTKLNNGLFIHQNMQIGSGSFDIPMNLIYSFRRKKMGFTLETNYKLNGSNSMGYSFGNRLNAALRGLRWIEKPKITYLPQISSSVEYASIDQQNNVDIEFTGGTTLLASLGCDLYLKRFAFGLHFHQPYYQNLGEGYTNSKTRMMANFIYLFNTKQKHEK